VNDFKAGDDAWYFTFPEDGCGGYDIDDIELGATYNLLQVTINRNPFLSFAYKSKDEAFKAMREKIDKLEQSKPREW